MPRTISLVNLNQPIMNQQIESSCFVHALRKHLIITQIKNQITLVRDYTSLLLRNGMQFPKDEGMNQIEPLLPSVFMQKFSQLMTAFDVCYNFFIIKVFA
jgi:hypothetical protein